MSTRLRRSKLAGEASIGPNADPKFPEIPMLALGENPVWIAGKYRHGKAAFRLGTIPWYAPAAKIVAILFMSILVLPQQKNSSSLAAFFWIFPGDFWVWPLWLATIIANAIILLIGDRDYDSFFASRYAYDRDFSAWIRIRTSTDSAREHRNHAVMMGIFITAACFVALETVFFSRHFFEKLWMLDKAIQEGNLHLQDNLFWLAHPVARSILASAPVLSCRILMKKGAHLYYIGREARADRIEDESARRRYNELRLKKPLDAHPGESNSKTSTKRQRRSMKTSNS